MIKGCKIFPRGSKKSTGGLCIPLEHTHLKQTDVEGPREFRFVGPRLQDPSDETSDDGKEETDDNDGVPEQQQQ